MAKSLGGSVQTLIRLESGGPGFLGQQALGYQPMRVGVNDADSTVENPLSMAPMFALSPADARKSAREVAKVVDGWQRHFRKCGVSKRDIELLAEQIDRPFLKEQRALA